MPGTLCCVMREEGPETLTAATGRPLSFKIGAPTQRTPHSTSSSSMA